MKVSWAAFGVLACALTAGAHAVRVSGAPLDNPLIDKAFQDFFDAPDAAAAAKRIDAVLKTGVTFDEALARVRRGRSYSQNVPKGLLNGHLRTGDGIEHNFSFAIPEGYDASRPHQVRVQLHGGVSRAAPPEQSRTYARRLPGTEDEIIVFPIAWVQSLWWQWSQVDNLDRILDRLKRMYNVDENRVYAMGVSDGGTGVYYQAFRNPTPWASFVPLIGNMAVLAAPDTMTDGQIYPGNAANHSFFIVNAGRDPLYPARVMQPLVGHLAKLGADVQFRVEEESGHSTQWWPDERARFEAFVEDHPREPLPDRISWETERPDRYGRAYWLIVDRLGDVPGQAGFSDTNQLDFGPEPDFGLRLDVKQDHGRRVLGALPGSNAEAIGLEAGDTVVAVDGRKVSSARDIFKQMQEWNEGGPVELTVQRAGTKQTLRGTFKPTEMDVPPQPIFPRGKPSGRVDLVRRGNVVEAKTHGVRAFTLLISPSTFDLQQPVKVVANGRTVFDGRVQPSVATLLKWAARDNDRTMVFGAELSINLDQ